MTEIGVSIICNTYNHEGYIQNAIESFLNQKTNFKYEILIHDDASTDKTQEIVEEYRKKYPKIIKPIYQSENQYSKGICPSLIYQFPRALGKYIAFCEGDDYWTDIYKLQKQYDILEQNVNIDICAHAATMVDANTGNKVLDISPYKKNCIIPIEDVIYGEKPPIPVFVATNSLFFRNELNKKIPEFRSFLHLDLTMQLHGALRGGMYFLKDNMSVYRFLSKGSWTLKTRDDQTFLTSFDKKKNKMFQLFDENTGGTYHDTIERRLLKNEFYSLMGKGQYKYILMKKYRIVFDDLSAMEKTKLYIKAIVYGNRQ